MQTLTERLRHAAETASDYYGLTFVDRRGTDTHHTWKQIYQSALRTAYFLHEQGYRTGDRLLIILPTCPEFFDVFFGAQLLGVTPVPVYPPMRLGKMSEYVAKTVAMCTAASAKGILSNKQISRVLGEVVAQASLSQGLVIVEQIKESPVCELPVVSPDDLAMAQFSSGTTSNPKPVGLTHAQVLANTDAILTYLEGDVGCSWLPLYHDMGLIGCVFPAVSLPGKLVLIPPEVFLAKPILWLQSISKHKAYVSTAPNFAYSYCVDRIKDKDLEGLDLSSWKIALNGAEAVAPAALLKFNERFSKIGLVKTALTPVYGLAEASLAVTFSDPKQEYSTLLFDREKLQLGVVELTEDSGSAVELATVGTPLPKFFVEIRAAETEALLPENKIGTIFVKGPSVMKGYLNDAPSPIKDGWLNTGDMGFLHQGKLYIHGREKDLIIVNGQNHAPQDIEQSIDSHPAVRTGCSAAVGNNSEDGEEIFLFVECLEHQEGLETELQGLIRSQTGITVNMIVLLHSGTLPRTSSGKIRRQETLTQFLNGSLKPPKKLNAWLVTKIMTKSTLGYLQSKWK